MRPVSRGDVPHENGIPRTVSDYKDWRLDLLNRIGNFCSYCNIVLNDSPQVEHVAPKSVYPALKLEWHNMLLACGPCNRAKGAKLNTPDTHLLPDYHNTDLAFEYLEVFTTKGPACILIPQASLSNAQRNKAQATIELCKLDAIVHNPRATDLRWKFRWEALLQAREWRLGYDELLETGSIPPRFYSLLATAAQNKGFFSICMNIFENVADVRVALIKAFRGTAELCFDKSSNYAGIIRACLGIRG